MYIEQWKEIEKEKFFGGSNEKFLLWSNLNGEIVQNEEKRTTNSCSVKNDHAHDIIIEKVICISIKLRWFHMAHLMAQMFHGMNTWWN